MNFACTNLLTECLHRLKTIFQDTVAVFQREEKRIVYLSLHNDHECSPSKSSPCTNRPRNHSPKMPLPENNNDNIDVAKGGAWGRAHHYDWDLRKTVELFKGLGG